MTSQNDDPLHGLTLATILEELVAHFGWAELGEQVKIKCFTSDPSISSSLKFLRRTPWARAKVESLYLFMRREQARQKRATGRGGRTAGRCCPRQELMTAVDHFQEGQLVGRYRIVRLIGEGGMGAVYEAIHPGLKKRVAVKVLLPRITESQEARVRFLREGEAASRINHPHVVSVFDVGEDGGSPYLVMEYLEGRTLDVFLAGRGALDLVEASDLFLPIMAAVAAGHECGVVHRDLKPPNIFLAQGRWGEVIPKVLDFGVSKLIDHDGPPVTRTETVLGTACYMSPEQARGARHVEARSDQFTLGLILYEMLTGRRAYRGENDLETLYNAAVAAIQPAHELRPALPDQVYALLTRMLAVSPSDRYPSLRDGARVLLPFASEKTRTAIARDFDALASAAPGSDQTEVAGTGPAGAPSGEAPATPVAEGREPPTRRPHPACQRRPSFR